MPWPRVYRYLDLHTFTNRELHRAFDRIRLCHKDRKSNEKEKDVITPAQIQVYLTQRIRQLQIDPEAPYAASSTDEEPLEAPGHEQAYATTETQHFLSVMATSTDSNISRSTFVHTLHASASSVDWSRTWPITLSMLLVGGSVGVVNPAMPFIVEHLSLSPAQYGTVVSAFAIAKLLGNIPAAIAVERYGRKPAMTYSMALLCAGVGGIGLAGSFEELYLCRLFTGLGVAALSTAGTLMMTDVSTPLNRASTMAPTMSAFSAGAALGPALGGTLVDQVGLHETFYCVGLSYVGVGVVNQMLLRETKPGETYGSEASARERNAEESDDNPQPTKQDTTNDKPFAHELSAAVSQWGPLFRDPHVQSVVIMNGLYWMSLAGGQMTLFPLVLAQQLDMTATQVGQVYMGMSLVQIVGNPVFAKVTDRIGKPPAIVAGCLLISSAMGMLPLVPYDGGISVEGVLPLAATVGIWSMGSSMLSTAPVSYISDRVEDHERAQAIAMLRTAGDVGFLLGAGGAGSLAMYWGSLDAAMQCIAGLLSVSTVWFGVNQYALERQRRIIEEEKRGGRQR